MVGLNPEQKEILATIERVASCFSLIGTLFIFLTFISSPDFRRPVNRLVFYASWGNALCNIATLISESGITAGPHSHLCRFQAFLIQMFVPADAFWNLALALNVWFTLYKNYGAHQLKALEWKYHIFCYGVPFVVAFTLLFVETHGRGTIYGPAVLWCWVARDWEGLRVALCYGPAWACIIAAFTIYIAAGYKIFSKRQELRAFHDRSPAESWENFKTTQIAVTSEVNGPLPFERIENNVTGLPINLAKVARKPKERSFDQYSVNISAPPRDSRPSMPATMLSQQSRRNRAAMEANRAAWGYTKVAILFFISLLVTWVPSSANRLYAIAHPDKFSVPLAYIAGLVLSLMGFWNSVIYIVTSRAACKTLLVSICTSGRMPSRRSDRKSLQETGMQRGTATSPAERWEEDLECLTPKTPRTAE